MKLYTATTIENGEDSIEITKNSGKHIAWVPVHCFASALTQSGPQIIVEFIRKRYGFDKKYIQDFIKENSIECIDLISAQEKFNQLR